MDGWWVRVPPPVSIMAGACEAGCLALSRLANRVYAWVTANA